MVSPAVPEWHEPGSDAGTRPLRTRCAETPGALPAGVWRGSELGSDVALTVPTGWAAFDAQLPGGGWPCHAISEVLAPQPGVLEWRLLAGALRHVVAARGQVVLVGPPKQPHLPGLVHAGLDARHLVWIRADTPAERLWVTEQMIKSNAAGAVVAWLPQARQDQIRRLHVCALACAAPVFLCRPDAARHEASAAPLRVQAGYDLDWALRIEIVKRRGPSLDAPLHLPSVPGGLEAVLTPRLLQPSVLAERQASPDVVGSPAPRRARTRQPAVH